MKNIYLYGASDDCNECETDFAGDYESYYGIKINHIFAYFVLCHFSFSFKNKFYQTIYFLFVYRLARLNCCGYQPTPYLTFDL